MPKVKKVVLAGLLLAVLIVFTRFIAIETPVFRISLGFIPFILGGWLLGPIWTAVIGISGDILGMLLMPKGSFFPGFTFNAMLEGLLYGLFLINKPVDKRFFLRLALSILTVHVVVQLGFNTLWLAIMLKKAFVPLMLARAVANIIRFPVELASMFMIMRFSEKYVNLYLRSGMDNHE
jgi:ECF transporter S component (folate family)